ncbi:MAG: DUF386 domain-containing protein [Bacteroidales bacterium]|nr:DUF386 domain-containing protein [Bacteroidales bacterium]
MILDTLENLGRYASINPLFPKVVEYLNKTNLVAQPDGKVCLEGNSLFANHLTSKGESMEDARLETHSKMIDIQIPLSCAETMGYSPRKSLPQVEYDAQKDVSFYQERPEQYITVHPGEFIVFFPEDGHAPCISNEEKIKKVVFKVKA